MLELSKGERTRLFSMIEDVSADDGPSKSEVTLNNGTTVKVYKVGTVIRVDMQPLTRAS